MTENKNEEEKFQQIILHLRESFHAEKNIEDKCKLTGNLQQRVAELEVKKKIHVWLDHLSRDDNILDDISVFLQMEMPLSCAFQLTKCLETLLELAGSTQFKSREKITSWMKTKKTDVENWCNSLKLPTNIDMLCKQIDNGDIFKFALYKTSKVTEFNTALTLQLAHILKPILSNLSKSDNQFLYILFIAELSLLHFNSVKEIFLKQLTRKSLLEFSKALGDSLKEFRSNDSSKLNQQCFTLLRFLQNVKETCTSSNCAHDMFLFAKEKLLRKEIEMEKQILDILRPDQSYDELRTNLQHASNLSRRANTISWDYFEKSSDSGIQMSTEANRNFHKTTNKAPGIFKLLGLENEFSAKIKLFDVLKIDLHALEEPKTWEDVPLWTIKKILASNFEFSDVIPEENQETENDLDNFLFGSDESDGIPVDTLKPLDPCFGSKAPEVIDCIPHAGDVFAAIFLCSDDFVRGLLARKMLKIRMAIPLALRYIDSSPLLLSWPFRGMRLENELYSVAQSRFKTVACLRFGITSFSKSLIINETLQEQHHALFYQKQHQSDTCRNISDGSIEMSWYIPGEKHCKFKEVVTILNLRGDAAKYEKEAKIAIDLADAIILFIEHSTIKTVLDHEVMSFISTHDLGVILVTSFPRNESLREAARCVRNLSEKLKCTSESFSVISIYDQKRKCNQEMSSICKGICVKLNNFISKTQVGEQFWKKINVVAIKFNAAVDENISNASKIRKHVDDLFANLDKYKKSDILPLQGKDMWLEWTKLLKSKCRKHLSDSYDMKETEYHSMSKVRKSQVEICNTIPPVIAMFLDKLVKYEKSQDALCYFISYLQNWLDLLSRKRLPQCRAKVMEARKNNPDDISAIKDAEEDMAESSIGIEHFFREIGQIFESFEYMKTTKSFQLTSATKYVFEKMPVLSAKLLLLGHPLEIMDGDAGNIPLKWIEATFTELEKLLPDKKFISISVIGIQSSGKSTLLNAMFGVEFAASSGRCTRGIFMNLIPIKKSACLFPQYDYIMLFDTEGLRAPEENENAKHDNELATMVVGLADIVLINIKGETIADMENVLHIVVFALLRIRQTSKEVNICPKCFFLHQNAEKSDALDEQMLRISNKLDSVTKLIADEEHIPGVTCFKDVIDFSPEENVKYISNLWLGHPPMSPISPLYSNDVASITKHLIQTVSTRVSTILDVRDSFEKIRNVWNAILAEDFVFSFRNSVEVKAYNELETRVRDVIHKLENVMQIHSLGIDAKLSRCKTKSDIEQVVLDLSEVIHCKILDLEIQSNEELRNFVKESASSEHMMHWLGNKEILVKQRRELMLKDFDIILNTRADHSKIKLENDIDSISSEMIDSARKLATQLRNSKLTETEKIDKFENQWSLKASQLAPKTAEETQDVRNKKNWHLMQKRLLEEYENKTHFVKTEMEKLTSSRENETKKSGSNVNHEMFSMTDLEGDEWEDQQTLLRRVRVFVFRTPQETERDVKKLVSDICGKINVKIETFLPDQEHGVTSFISVLNLMRSEIQKHNEDKEKHFIFTPIGEIKMAVKLCHFLHNRFCKLNLEYHGKHSLQHWQEGIKETARGVFIDTIQEREDIVIAANQFCTGFFNLIKDRIEKLMPFKIKQFAFASICTSKYQMLSDYLVHLAKKEVFEHYKPVLADPESACRNYFLALAMERYCEQGSPSRYSKEVCQEIEKDVENLIKIVNDIAEEENKKNKTNVKPELHKWIEQISNKMTNLAFKAHYHKDFMHYKVSDYKGFQSVLEQTVADNKKNIISRFGNTPNISIYSILKDKLRNEFTKTWECTENCPFCGEPCMYTSNHLKDQKHRCIQHRPHAVQGGWWKNTNVLKVENCNWSIEAENTRGCGKWCGCTKKDCDEMHPYREYKKYKPDWDIEPQKDMSNSPYWCWFVVRFGKDLANYYGKKEPEIPSSWKDITKDSAIKSLQEYVPTKARK